MFDLVLLAIIGISALLGLMRGFVGVVDAVAVAQEECSHVRPPAR